MIHSNSTGIVDRWRKKKIQVHEIWDIQKLIENGLRSRITHQGYIQNSKAATSQTTEIEMGERNNHHSILILK